MIEHRILLPYNFSESDRKALEFAVRLFADRTDAELTLFHAYTPLPPIEISGESITGKLKESFSYLNTKISEQEGSLRAVQAELVQRGFAEDRTKAIFKPRKKDIAGEILELSKEAHFNVVILNRKPGRIARFFSGSVHSRVLASLRNSAVCVIS